MKALATKKGQFKNQTEMLKLEVLFLRHPRGGGGDSLPYSSKKW